jgi:hypothetical protein
VADEQQQQEQQQQRQQEVEQTPDAMEEDGTRAEAALNQHQEQQKQHEQQQQEQQREQKQAGEHRAQATAAPPPGGEEVRFSAAPGEVVWVTSKSDPVWPALVITCEEADDFRRPRWAGDAGTQSCPHLHDFAFERVGPGPRAEAAAPST